MTKLKLYYGAVFLSILIFAASIACAQDGARGRVIRGRTPVRPERNIQVEKADEDDEIIEMHGVDRLDTLLNFVQRMTDKVIVYDAGIKATRVKIFGTAKVPRKDLLRFVETILEMNGCTMAEAPGNVLKVVQINDVTEPIAVHVGSADDLPDTSSLITQVVNLKHADPTKVSNLVKTMVTPKEGKVTLYDDLSAIFITDAAYKVKNILGVIEQLDQPSPEVKLTTLNLKFTSATEVARTLDALMQKKAAREKTGRKAAERAYIVADERSSSVIVLGLQEEIDDVIGVLKTLDRPLEEQQGTFHSYQLKNSSAVELAKVLVELYQKKTQSLRSGGAKPGESREPSIVPEPNTNSLLIIAPSDVYKEMSTLIAKLDVRRPQVLIEVMLVEVSLDQTSESGIELATGDVPKRGTNTLYAGTGFGLSTISINDDGIPVRIPSLGTGLFAGMFHGTTHIPIILRAWETLGDVEVLAVPRVLTNDNSDATISIGDEVPYQKTSIQNDIRDITWGSSSAQMKLQITPHISEAEHLRLDLDFTMERFGAQLDETAPPPKSSRNASTKVTIPNENTIIIGGLTHTTVRDTESRVPVLHRIPLLGRAFAKNTKVKSKNHLFIFITPHIMREDAFEDLNKISNKVEMKMKDVRKGDWRTEIGTWGTGTKAETEDKPPLQVMPLNVKTEISEEKNVGQPNNAPEIGRKRSSQRRQSR